MLDLFEKAGTEHDEDPSNEILKILDMRPTSTRKHGWIFAKMVPIPTTNHKMKFG